MDSWDCCIAEDDLFSRKVGATTHLLNELVERSINRNGSPVSIDFMLDEMSAIPVDSPTSSVENVQVVSCDGAAAISADKRTAPKILKKKSTLNGKKNENTFKHLKKVTFEVERMVAEEAYSGTDREDAKARIAVRLGAAPAKSTFVNYKQLKQDRVAEAAAKKIDEDGLRPMLMQIKKKPAAKRGRINKTTKN